MLLDDGEEGGNDIVSGDWGVGGAGQQEPGVVIQPVQDLDVGPVGEAPMGEVGLPSLVRLGGLEPDERRLGALARLGGDQAFGVQDAADRGGRGRAVSVLLEMPGDRDRARVMTIGGQLSTQGDDPVAIAAVVAAGFDFGRLECGSTASNPPSR